MDKVRQANMELARISLKTYGNRAEDDSITVPSVLRGKDIEKVLETLDTDGQVMLSWVCVDNDLAQCELYLKEEKVFEEYIVRGEVFGIRSETMTIREALANDWYLRYANFVHVRGTLWD